MFKLGNLECESRKKISGYWEIDEYKIPTTIINGSEKGRVVCISAGIHNCEYTSIQTAIDLAKEIEVGDVKGTLVILHTVNYSGFFKRIERVVPEDMKNLNRVFPGDKNGSISERIAYAFSNILYPQLDFFVDIHGGDLFEMVMPFIYAPGIGEKDVIDFSHKVASYVSLPLRVRSSSKTGAYNSCAIDGVPSLLFEIGGNATIEEQNLELYKKCMREVLSYLDIIKGDKVKNLDQIEVTEAKYIDSPQNGYWYPNFKAGDKFRKDDVLGTIKDVFGNLVQEFRAEFDGIILYQKISLAIPSGDPLVAYGKIKI